MSGPLHRTVDGEPVLSAEAMALLFGVTAEEFRAESDRQRTLGLTGFTPPAGWVRRGRRIAKECRMALGGDGSMKAALDYLVARAAERDQ